MAAHQGATLVMGIVNVTPDSFSDGGRYLAAREGIEHGLLLRDLGADILDVGGESTRPGAERVPAAEEERRVLPVIRGLVDAGAVVSVDTMNASTAAAAVGAGARIINDVSGGLADPGILRTAAEAGVDIALGHWRGHSQDMYAGARYDDVAAEVVGELSARVAAAVAAGVVPERIILDPGVGFGKRGAQNWQILRALQDVVALGPRVLVGTSRKGFLADVLGPDADVERRDLATAVTSVLASQAGVWGVRVHDVRATVDALAVLARWKSDANTGADAEARA